MAPTAHNQGDLRNFIQFGGGEVGATPNVAVQYGGVATQHFIIGDATAPTTGNITPIYVPDPLTRRKLVEVDFTEDPPERPTASVMFKSDIGYLSIASAIGRCPINFYQAWGYCEDPSDFLAGWGSKLRVFANGRNTNKGLGGQSAFESTETIMDTLDFSFERIYDIGRLNTDRAVTLEDEDTVAVVYGSASSCISCQDGTEAIYVLTTDAATDQPSLWWSLDGASTWTTGTLGTWVDEVVTDMALAGGYLIITYDGGTYGGDGGYFVVSLDSVSGVPSFANPPKVESGFTLRYPQAVYAVSPTQVLFASQDGYIYRSNQLLAGVVPVESGGNTAEDLLRIHGNGNVVVAVGNTNTVLFSEDGGANWSLVQDNPSLGTVRSVHVLSRYRWWIIGDNGVDTAQAAYTLDGGRSWSYVAPPAPGALIEATDVRFANDEVGYLLFRDNSTGNNESILFGTTDGGNTWNNQLARIATQPTATNGVLMTRIAVPVSASNETIKANNAIVIGDGLGADTDSYVFTLTAPIR
jgi:hypothetical protein